MTVKLNENLEIKARVLDVDGIQSAAKGLATEYLGIMQQKDTYFDCREGRLKLREIKWEQKSDTNDAPDQSAELIWYVRSDTETAKPSRYRMMEVKDPESLAMTLTDSLGCRDIVSKRREVMLYKNVRIHLDEVEGLGHFMELEAVQPGDSAIDSADSADFDSGVQLGLLDWMMEQLGVTREHLIASSYVDLV